jgi:ribosomal protein S3AE
MAKKDKKQKPKKPEPKKKEKPTTRRKKGTKKKFFSVDLPLTASNVNLYSYSQEDLSGSVVKLDLTKNLRGKNLELRAKIILKDEKLSSQLLSLKLIQSYVKRVMRRGTDYIEDSFETSTKDSKLRIKPLIITRNRVSRAIRNEIRKIARKNIESYTTIRDTKEIFSDIMTSKLQKTISQKIKKIYPPALCEIRWIEYIGPADKPKPLKIVTSEKDKKE